MDAIDFQFIYSSYEVCATVRADYLTSPLIEINLLSALMNEDELSSSTTSRWTLRVVKQVKIMAQRFEFAAPPRVFLVIMVQGPKVSMPTLVNGGPGMMRSSGRSAIFCFDYFLVICDIQRIFGVLMTRVAFRLLSSNLQIGLRQM